MSCSTPRRFWPRATSCRRHRLHGGGRQRRPSYLDAYCFIGLARLGSDDSVAVVVELRRYLAFGPSAADARTAKERGPRFPCRGDEQDEHRGCRQGGVQTRIANRGGSGMASSILPTPTATTPRWTSRAARSAVGSVSQQTLATRPAAMAASAEKASSPRRAHRTRLVVFMGCSPGRSVRARRPIAGG